jgi:hypothetical protein
MKSGLARSDYVRSMAKIANGFAEKSKKRETGVYKDAGGWL